MGPPSCSHFMGPSWHSCQRYSGLICTSVKNAQFNSLVKGLKDHILENTSVHQLMGHFASPMRIKQEPEIAYPKPSKYDRALTLM